MTTSPLTVRSTDAVAIVAAATLAEDRLAQRAAVAAPLAVAESISRNLRPGVLDMLGLVAVLRDAGEEFAQRTGVAVQLDCAPLTKRLPDGVELALYRIFQIVLNNVEKHAHAHHRTVGLKQSPDFIQLTIKDDGVGFEPGSAASRGKRSSLGLLRMRERANFVGGALEVKSARNAGTEIDVRIPLSGHSRGSSRRFTRSAPSQKA